MVSKPWTWYAHNCIRSAWNSKRRANSRGESPGNSTCTERGCHPCHLAFVPAQAYLSRQNCHHSQRTGRFATPYLHHLLRRIANPQSSPPLLATVNLVGSAVHQLASRPKIETSYCAYKCAHTMNVQIFMVCKPWVPAKSVVLNNYDGLNMVWKNESTKFVWFETMDLHKLLWYEINKISLYIIFLVWKSRTMV
jgi:hypothetical protein